MAEPTAGAVRLARVIRVSELPHVHDPPPSLRPLQLLRGPILALHRVRRRLWDGQPHLSRPPRFLYAQTAGPHAAQTHPVGQTSMSTLETEDALLFLVEYLRAGRETYFGPTEGRGPRKRVPRKIAAYLW
jgi:hypothetical protein